MKVLIAKTEKTEKYENALRNLGVDYVCSVDRIESDDFDGLLIPGGWDINPERYNEEVQYDNVVYSDEVDEKQLAILDSFVKAGKPILGICRGMQLINVYFGGTLYQNIENHRIDVNHESYHAVETYEGSFMYDCYGKQARVNSSHHQAVKKLAENFKVMQRAEDGTIESIIHDFLPIIAVQYHPEKMSFENRTDDTLIDGKYIFEYFISMKKRA